MRQKHSLTGKKSLHRMLITRIALVTIVVSAVVSAIVIHREQGRVLTAAHDRALIRTGTLAVLIKDQLDAPGLGDHAEIQRMLNLMASKGIELSTGHYVFARILDPAGGEVARLEDRNHKNLAGILRYAGTEQLRLMGMKEGADFTPVRIEGHDYIRALIPLADSRGAAAAHVEAFFATTPEADRAARRNIINSAVLAFGIVLATSLLLYPVIVGLMRRLERLSLNLLDANLEMVGVVGSTIAKRDSDTDAHNFRVTIYSVRVAEALGLGDADIRILIKGAFLHDVGKIGIRDHILHKPGKLDEKEFDEMKLHVNHGLDIVFKSVWLKEASAVVGSHHEKYEGNGYPAGLRGEAIPVLARIFAISDVFDALTSHRPYKQPLSYDETMDILMKGRGSHFDPEILDVFMKISRPLFEQYGGADEDRAHKDMDGIVNKYYKADVATFLD
jgi:HD-GYP domain-containing protein (c-di-GMP phosphodiesterase class II)